MLKDTVNTQDVERKIAALEWQIREHKALERKMADVFYFLRATLGGTGIEQAVELDMMARNGLDFLLNSAARALYTAEGGEFSELEGDFFGREKKAPESVKDAA